MTRTNREELPSFFVGTHGAHAVRSLDFLHQEKVRVGSASFLLITYHPIVTIVSLSSLSPRIASPPIVTILSLSPHSPDTRSIYLLGTMPRPGIEPGTFRSSV